MDTRQSWTLYLDFDGVLNNDPYLRHQNNHSPREEHRLFDPQNLEAADFLCRELPIEAIIVTSTWRVGRSVEQLQALLRDEGFEHSHLIVDATHSIGERPEEIRAHVKRSGVQRFLILDDIQLHPFKRPTFFRTSASLGLTRPLAREILHALE